MKKPTIAELEQNGEIKMDFVKCAWREECRASEAEDTHDTSTNNASAPCRYCNKLPKGDRFGAWRFCPWCGYEFARRTLGKEKE
jgi:hypothetical protein